MLANLPSLSQHLANEWAMLQNGLQTWSFEQGRVLLTLAVGDVRDMLDELTVEADSVYLDGFNPARNPQMWEAATLQRVATHCRTGTRIATFTVASMVLNGLKAQGFEVQKRPGLPPKWGRLEGVKV
jgi:tRNA 5-methylaminomethyl-2-thiouridine biosynthesis bifunctional protein